jgi:hypothetical protein
MMNTTPAPPSCLDNWRAFFAAMDRLHAMAPWQWMHDSDCVAVCNPANPDETVYCSVLGRCGEHFGISAFVGARGFASYLGMYACGGQLSDDFIVALDCFMLSFDDRDCIEPYQKDVFKQLGLKYRGRDAWPIMRRFHPHIPSTEPTAADLDFAAHFIDQCMGVAQRFRTNRTILPPLESGTLLTRVPYDDHGTLAWKDALRAAPEPPAATRMAPVPPPPALLEEVRQTCTRRAGEWECDCRVIHAVIGPSRQAGRFPQLLLCVDHAQGLVLGFALMEQADDWHAVPDAFLNQCRRIGALPTTLLLCSAALADVLAPTLTALKIAVRQLEMLSNCNDAFVGATAFLQQGPPKTRTAPRK